MSEQPEMYFNYIGKSKSLSTKFCREKLQVATNSKIHLCVIGLRKKWLFLDFVQASFLCLDHEILWERKKIKVFDCGQAGKFFVVHKKGKLLELLWFNPFADDRNFECIRKRDGGKFVVMHFDPRSTVIIPRWCNKKWNNNVFYMERKATDGQVN